MNCCNEGMGEVTPYGTTSDLWDQLMGQADYNQTFGNTSSTGWYAPGYDTVGYGASGSNGGVWGAISTALKSASGILGTRYSVPQLNPGQLIQTGPYGTIMSQSGNGIPGASSLNLGAGGSSSLLLIGGAALLVFMLAKK